MATSPRPRSWTEWAALVRATVAHLVDRYGHRPGARLADRGVERAQPRGLLAGADQDAYFRLYEVTARTRSRTSTPRSRWAARPSLRAPTSGWSPFADFVTARDVPVDFVSRHAYTSGPAQHVPFGTHQTLRRPRRCWSSSPRRASTCAGTALAGLPVHITEFNSSYRPDNPIHDTAFHAAYLAPVLAAGGDLVDSFSYWTFSDVFEEAGSRPSLFHGGFGLLTHRQIKKPTYHLYAFMARMGDAGAGARRGPPGHPGRDGRVTVLAWAPVDVTGR